MNKVYDLDRNSICFYDRDCSDVSSLIEFLEKIKEKLGGDAIFEHEEGMVTFCTKEKYFNQLTYQLVSCEIGRLEHKDKLKTSLETLKEPFLHSEIKACERDIKHYEDSAAGLKYLINKLDKDYVGLKHVEFLKKEIARFERDIKFAEDGIESLRRQDDGGGAAEARYKANIIVNKRGIDIYKKILENYENPDNKNFVKDSAGNIIGAQG